MKVQIAKLDKLARIPQYRSNGAGCFDFEALEDTTVGLGEMVLIRTGLVIQVPEGYFLAIAPRSSCAKLGLSMPHSFGIIDADYCGREDEIKILVKNTTDQPIEIKQYQRIAQGFIVEAPKVAWLEISPKELPKTSRGGFGSTGS